MRLFIDFDLSNDCKKYLVSLINGIKKSFPDLAFVDEQRLHLTLKFLGDVSDDKVDKIVDCLSKISFRSFSVSLSQLGLFPSESYFRVLWVGLEPKEVICSLQNQIDNSLKCLFDKETGFQPHITLARIKFVKNKEQFIDFIKSLKIKPISFEVHEFKLVKSTLQKGGSLYETIETFPNS